jgi:UDP-glucose 4-epimerase
MRVLITGGCGFVGANLIAQLNRAGGYAIRVFDNESLGKRQHIAGLEAEFVHGDIRDRPALDKALAGMDAVIHLAADTRVMDSIAAPAFNFDVNVVGSFRLLEAMRAAGITRLVNASTGGAILGETLPPVHEEMVPRPLSPYGAAKLAVEGYCSAFGASYGMKPVSLRFSNVYGPRSFHKGSVVAAFMKRILAGKPVIVYGDGEQTRDYVFVADLCQGIVAGLTSAAPGVYQLGSGGPLSINGLIAAIAEVVAPHRMEVRFEPSRAGEVMQTWCDIAKARGELGYAPATTLGDGLAQTWAWFVQQA